MKHFSLKTIILTSFLAVAGIFGATSVVVNQNIKETPVVEKAEATETKSYSSSTDSSTQLTLRILVDASDGGGEFANSGGRAGVEMGGAFEYAYPSSWFPSGTTLQASNYHEVYLNGLPDMHYWYAEALLKNRNYSNSTNNKFYVHRYLNSGTWTSKSEFTCGGNSLMNKWYDGSFTSNSMYLTNADAGNSYGIADKGIIYKIQLQTKSSYGGSYTTEKLLVYQTTYECVLPTPTNIPSGYRFAGWYTRENGAGTAYNNPFNVGGDLVLYAKYVSYSSASTYTILGSGTYMADGKTWNSDYGLKMTVNNDGTNYANFENVYLTAGDVIKVVDNNGLWYGWDECVSSIKTSNFYEAKYNYVKVTYNTSDTWQNWNFELKNYESVNGGSGETNQVDNLWRIYWNVPSSWTNVITGSGYQGVRGYYYQNETGTEYWTRSKASGSDYTIDDSHTLNDRSYLQGINIYKNNTGTSSNTGTKYISRDRFGNGNIVVKTTGYYSIYITKKGQIDIHQSGAFYPTDSIYLDLGTSGWADKMDSTLTPLYYAHFWNTADTSDTVDILGVKVEGDSNTKLYEFIIDKTPSKKNMPNRVKFARAHPTQSTGTWVIDGHNVWSRSADISFSTTKNIYKLTSCSWDSTGDWNSNKTPLERANNFGTYLLSATATQCAKYNTNTGSSFTSSIWPNAKAQYDSMNTRAKKYFTIADPSIDSTYAKNQAAARYDYIVNKYNFTGSTNDFAGRRSGGNFMFSSSIRDFSPFSVSQESEEDMTSVVIIIASSISLLSLTALGVLILKKRKIKHTNN